MTGCRKDGIVLQPGETVAYRWVNKNELTAMSRSDLVTERMQAFITKLHAEE